MVLLHKLFLGYPMVWVSFQCIQKKWVKFEFCDFSKKSFSYFLIFWPVFMTLTNNFQCQEDSILWNFLCDNFRKKMSADFSCLFTFSKKTLNIFSSFVITRKISLWMADNGEFSNLCNFHQNFLWHYLAQNFINFKIHH